MSEGLTMKLKDLFTDTSKWTQHYSSRDRHTAPCPIDCKDAVCWCLAAAIDKCYMPLERADIRNKITKYIGFPSIMLYNDNDKTTFNDIKQLVETLDI